MEASLLTTGLSLCSPRLAASAASCPRRMVFKRLIVDWASVGKRWIDKRRSKSKRKRSLCEGLLGNERWKDCAVAKGNVRVEGSWEGNGAPVADFGAEVRTGRQGRTGRKASMGRMGVGDQLSDWEWGDCRKSHCQPPSALQWTGSQWASRLSLAIKGGHPWKALTRVCLLPLP